MTYKTKPIKPSTVDFDLIVIGTGAGGGVASHYASKKGKKVAVIEQDKIGGECPNYGCVPTKALLQAAETYNTIKQAPNFGIHPGEIKINLNEINAWKNQAVKNTGTKEGIESYQNSGITVYIGHAHFLDPWTISVNGKRHTAHNFLIATGTHDMIPAIPGLKETGFISYRQALELTKLPKKLVIIGGGAIGSEFTHYFSTFGVEVHLVEFFDRLLYREDEEMGNLLETIFENNGVYVHKDSKVLKVEKKGAQKIVSFETHGKINRITVDEILLAAGKVPNTDLGLENAGVDYTHHGITVDNTMVTSNPHIYAAGDVTGGYMFTHTAAYQSRIAGQNIFSSLKFVADYKAVPRVIYVAPEFASTGATEAELTKKGVKYQVATVPTSIIGRANTSQEDTGFVKILANKKGVILGGSIVAPRAGEMIQELTLAVQWRMKASKLDYTIHAYPTWSQAVRICASKIICR
jgi:mercuric reductase